MRPRKKNGVFLIAFTSGQFIIVAARRLPRREQKHKSRTNRRHAGERKLRTAWLGEGRGLLGETHEQEHLHAEHADNGGEEHFYIKYILIVVLKRLVRLKRPMMMESSSHGACRRCCWPIGGKAMGSGPTYRTRRGSELATCRQSDPSVKTPSQSGLLTCRGQCCGLRTACHSSLSVGGDYLSPPGHSYGILNRELFPQQLGNTIGTATYFDSRAESPLNALSIGQDASGVVTRCLTPQICLDVNQKSTVRQLLSNSIRPHPGRGVGSTASGQGKWPSGPVVVRFDIVKSVANQATTFDVSPPASVIKGGRPLTVMLISFSLTTRPLRRCFSKRGFNSSKMMLEQQDSWCGRPSHQPAPMVSYPLVSVGLTAKLQKMRCCAPGSEVRLRAGRVTQHVSMHTILRC
ncbi:hypothetical protein VP01_2626g1 [Puccinia sorghi]|uniref:Uncharacterized protein n=1 Tax=Puccinia sorghi TaxID=27349 RepID=A0A0L6V4G3_9BASI|nr:hypothetical protein VP01_2626g1 [Puccinia sorghi]